MNPDNLNKWLTLIANLGVLIGVFAVVFELRQTQSALEVQAYQDRANTAIDFTLELSGRADDAVLFDEVVSGNIEIGSLSNEQKSVISLLIQGRLADIDNEFYQYRKGFIDRDFYETTTVPDMKLFAPLWRELDIPEKTVEFTQEIDRVLAIPLR